MIWLVDKRTANGQLENDTQTFFALKNRFSKKGLWILVALAVRYGRSKHKRTQARSKIFVGFGFRIASYRIGYSRFIKDRTKIVDRRSKILNFPYHLL